MSLGSEPWVEWFCRSHPFYVEVPEDYIRDDFNLTGLPALVLNFEEALDVILDNDFDDDENDIDAISDESGASDHSYSTVNRSAAMLYGLIHARYILTPEGLKAMWEKYLDQAYGICPRDCNTATMPYGMTTVPGLGSTAVYCGVCRETYRPSNYALSVIDGCHFGSTFCHLFFLEFADRIPAVPPVYYVPKIFGYKVSPVLRDKKILGDLHEQKAPA